MKSIVCGFITCLIATILIRHVWPQGFLLYQGLGVSMLVAIAMLLTRHGWKDCLLVFLLAYAFIFTVPTTVDRAYSVRMINHIAASPNGVDKPELQAMFTAYFNAGGGVDRRLAEQYGTGSITQQDGRIVATPVGHFLARAFHFTAWVFAAKED